MGNGEFGKSRQRIEDLRFLTGGGCYVDDMAPEGLVHACILRSPHAHAVLRGIDTAEAAASPGVLAVLTAPDQEADGIGHDRLRAARRPQLSQRGPPSRGLPREYGSSNTRLRCRTRGDHALILGQRCGSRTGARATSANTRAASVENSAENTAR